MSRMTRLLAGAFLLASTAAWNDARAATIVSAADPSLAGARLIDFNDQAHAMHGSLTIDGVTFSTEHGSLKTHEAGWGGTYGGSGMEMSTRYLGRPYAFDISFDAPADAFGMVWGAANPDWLATAWDADGKVIETAIFGGGDGPASYVEYYGIAAANISRVTIQSLGGFDWVKIDDFRYVPSGSVSGGLSGALSPVPLPGALPLLAAALGGLAVLRRRR